MRFSRSKIGQDIRDQDAGALNDGLSVAYGWIHGNTGIHDGGSGFQYSLASRIRIPMTVLRLLHTGNKGKFCAASAHVDFS